MSLKLYTSRWCYEAKDLQEFIRVHKFDDVGFADVCEVPSSADAAGVEHVPTLLINGADKVVGKAAIIDYLIRQYHKRYVWI